jgi:hypothetical protein
LQRGYHGAARRLGALERHRSRIGDLSIDRALEDDELRAARAVARHAYFEELERALHG